MKKIILFLALFFLLSGASAISIDFTTTGYSGASVQTADLNMVVYVIPFPTISIDDNTLPSFIAIWPTEYTQTQEPVVRFWIEIEDDWDVKGGWYRFYLNGFLDDTGFADVNSDGFSTILTSDLVVTGDQGYIIVFAITDIADNNLILTETSGIYSFEELPHVFEPVEVIDEEIVDAVMYSGYTIFTSVGTYAGPLLLVVLGSIVLYITILFAAMKRV